MTLLLRVMCTSAILIMTCLVMSAEGRKRYMEGGVNEFGEERASLLDAFPESVLKLAGLTKTSIVRNGKASDIVAAIDDLVEEIHKDKKDSLERWPVLFVPGLMGSQLEVELKDRPPSLNIFCKRNTKTGKTIHTWLPSLTEVLPFAINCWQRNMSLKWNNETSSMDPLETGVSVHPIQKVDSVINLSDQAPVFTGYAYALQQLGYVPEQDMVAFAYDWRLGPESYSKPGGLFELLKQKIERTVRTNGGRGVVACSISMGGPFFATFLASYVDVDWRRKHIHAFVSLSGVMSGSSLAPAALVNGYIFHEIPAPLPKYISSKFYETILTMPSVSWLFPASETFGKAPLIKTPSMSYSAETFDKMLMQAGQDAQADLWSINKKYAGMAIAPRVHTFCLSGYGIPTPNTFTFDKDDFSGEPSIGYSDGDGTVQLESLRVCDDWKNVQKEPITPIHFFNNTHTELLYSIDAIKVLLAIVTTQNVSTISVS